MVVSTTSVYVVSFIFRNSDMNRLIFSRIGEMNIGIICACMPACAAIFRDKFPSGLHVSLTTIKYWFSRSTSHSTSESTTKVNESPDESNPGRFHSHQDGYLALRGAAEGSEKVPAPAPTLARSDS